MNLLSIFIIAIGLAMDAFAVSIVSGVTIQRMHIRHALRIALFFGGFQALMPLLGWLCGNWATKYVQEFDHWVAFALLSVIGGKMIHESFQMKDEDSQKDPLNLYILFALAVATSIDAFAVGLTFSFLKGSILTPVLIIGLVTFGLSFLGTYIGNRFGHIFENKIEIAGGLILIGMGLKILIEHLI
jgi:putative Mn2+ efflux pump MntP